jgi:dihydrofolate reductase
MITLYNVISADGFIARENGDEDFIPDELWSSTLELYKEYGIVVMGRKTYETIQSYDKDTIKQLEGLLLKKVIVSSNLKFVPKPGYAVTHSIEEITILGPKILITSGPTLNSSLLRAGLVDQIILNTLPDKIGSGIRVFDVESNLTLISEEDKGAGRKWCVYKVNK